MVAWGFLWSGRDPRAPPMVWCGGDDDGRVGDWNGNWSPRCGPVPFDVTNYQSSYHLWVHGPLLHAHQILYSSLPDGLLPGAASFDNLPLCQQKITGIIKRCLVKLPTPFTNCNYQLGSACLC